MLKRTILYLAIAALIFIGAEKALTQDTAIVGIILNIELEPAYFTGDWWDAVYTVPWDLPGGTLIEDGGSLSRAITIHPGDQNPLFLVHSFGAPSPSITHVPQPSQISTTPAGFLDDWNSLPRLAIGESSPPIEITEPGTTMWHLTFWYAETMTALQYNQIMTWELTVL